MSGLILCKQNANTSKRKDNFCLQGVYIPMEKYNTLKKKAENWGTEERKYLGRYVMDKRWTNPEIQEWSQMRRQRVSVVALGTSSIWRFG